ncbi:uncharacterized protein LOC115628064 isoform X3 [Scaptodrosophila lebanonensis]|nr:uncharacterized protein LOC115628064 isoform X3 [Scaptodrosophila lebanonensis]XP_030379891.1 uncharacterized protein LOC115628064 isoform X3 [Scaptodrosophila lebanonensis]
MDESGATIKSKLSDSSTNKNLTSASQDETLCSSTSNAFNTWTILPAERIELLDNISNQSHHHGVTTTLEEESIQQTSSKECERLANERPLDDPQADDISDGISIISDCESTGRISPRSFMRDQLHELNMKLDVGMELPTPILPLLITQNEESNLVEDLELEQVRQRRRALQRDEDLPPTTTSASSGKELQQAQSAVNRHYLPPLVQSGLSAVFYVGVTLAVLAFIGKLRYPEWQVLGNGKPIADLEQRLNDVELQNNLLRAEIDIMSKQLNYLNSMTSGQSGLDGQRKDSAGRKGKTFKVWSGNGHSIDPVDITKEDLKRPYQCPDGKFVDIAAMCIENKPYAESLTDEIGSVVNNVLQKSQTFQNFEKITEKLGTFTEAKEDDPTRPTESVIKNDGQKDSNTYDANKRMPQRHNKDSTYKPKVNEHSKEYTSQYKRENHHSKERYNQKRSKSKEDNSKERYNNRKYGDKSREDSHEKSSERPKHSKRREDDSGSGEWYEGMMHQRKNARLQNEQKRNKNWYIERGNGREQKRSAETRH